MPVYTIAHLKFKNIDAYRRYQNAFPAVFKKFNGTALAADERPLLLEGEWTSDKVVVLSFPDEASALRFGNDPEYRAIAADRRVGADATVLLVHGLESSR